MIFSRKFMVMFFSISQIFFSQQLQLPNTYNHSINKKLKLGVHTVEDWRHKIDSTWGEGISNITKLRIFDDFWKTIDEEYPSFHNIDVDWDSLRNVFRPEVISGVSKGRFYAIMSQLFFSLRDFHTRMVDIEIARTELKHGTPVLVPWGHWEVGHFGAALAPTKDNNLFVYKVVDEHPLDLKVGDIVLGYDGILWKDMYQQMFEIQFPLAASMDLPFRKAVWGTTPSAYKHIWLCSAGMNWHLFDTIDIVKYASKDTVHLSTRLLENKNMNLIATAQLPIKGVPMPDIKNGHAVSYGIIEGTNIGYIYIYGWHLQVWSFSPGDEFKEAFDSLRKNYDLEGLIIDARICDGGHTSEFQKIFPLFFDENWNELFDDIRADPNDHYTMKTFDHNGLFFKAEDDKFDRPIAVLTGPVAQSMGDIAPFVFKSHPYARLFGLPTNGAFGYVNPDFNKRYGNEVWEEWITLSNMRPKNIPDGYLTHIGYSIDDTVWLELEDVVKGDDTVVKKAIKWIRNAVSVDNHSEKNLSTVITLSPNYPNPFNPATLIQYSFPVAVPSEVEGPHVTLKIYDILGREVATLVNQKQKPGNYEVSWDASNHPSGVYFYQLKSGNYTETKKMILVR